METASGLSNQTTSKNQLQALLLGVGLFLRDHELACFTNHEEVPVPGYIADSGMAASDADSINRVLQSISNAIHNDLGYVHLYNWVI